MGSISFSGDIADFLDAPGFIGVALQKLPLEALTSKQFVTIVDALAEGEVEGFPSAVGLTKGTNAYNIAALNDV